MSFRLELLLSAIAAVVVGVLAGWALFGRPVPSTSAATSPAAAASPAASAVGGAAAASPTAGP